MNLRLRGFAPFGRFLPRLGPLLGAASFYPGSGSRIRRWCSSAVGPFAVTATKVRPLPNAWENGNQLFLAQPLKIHLSHGDMDSAYGVRDQTLNASAS